MADLDITVDANLTTATTVDGLADRLIIVQGGTVKDVAPSVLLNNGGWIEISDSWSYASASTITVPSGAAAKYQKWMRIRFKQGGGYKYYVVQSLSDTVLTVVVNTDYTVANSGISDIAYSFIDKPFGFPDEFNVSIAFTNLTVGSGTLVSKLKVSAQGLISHHWELDLAADSAVGTDPNYALPITKGTHGTNHVHPIGILRMTDTGSAVFNTGVVEALSASAYLRCFGAGGTYATSLGISATVPFTWASTDKIAVSTSYFG
jgi:hypothetical protein